MCCFGKQCSNLEYSKKYLGIAKIYMMEKIIFCKMRATTYESRLTGVIVQLQSWELLGDDQIQLVYNNT